MNFIQRISLLISIVLLPSFLLFSQGYLLRRPPSSPVSFFSLYLLTWPPHLASGGHSTPPHNFLAVLCHHNTTQPNYMITLNTNYLKKIDAFLCESLLSCLTTVQILNQIIYFPVHSFPFSILVWWRIRVTGIWANSGSHTGHGQHWDEGECQAFSNTGRHCKKWPSEYIVMLNSV